VRSTPTSDLPRIEGLHHLLIPTAEEHRWDHGELPQAVLNLDSQTTLSRCDVLLRLAVVARRSLDQTQTARAVALREILREPLPKDLDHPTCDVLRALADLAQGTAGRSRNQRQEAAGRVLGEGTYAVHPRSVRRRVKQEGWPWLLDRLIEQEVQARKVLEAEEREWLRAAPISLAFGEGSGGAPLATNGLFPSVPASTHPPTAPAEACWLPAVAPIPWGLLPSLDEEPGPSWLVWALPAVPESGTLDDDLKRRTFLLGIPAAWILSRSRLSHPFGIRVQAAALDEATLDELAAAIAAEKRLCHQLGSRAVYEPIIGHVRRATGLLRGSPPPGLRPRLAAIASEAAAEAGFVCNDQRQLPAARSYYQLAAELAHEADDPSLEAFVLGNWSMRLKESGDAPQALPFLGSAQTVAARRPSPATLAYLATAEADTRASLGDADASLRALDRAEGALDRGDPAEDSRLFYWLNDAVLAGWRGRCLTRLGRVDDADASLTRAVSAWDPSFVYERAITLVGLAALRLRQEELEECCRLAEEGLALAVSTSSPGIVERVQDLRLELEPWRDSPGVKDLDEQMVAASWV
jgi:tetratricopeptide (TPR) repeat protein